MKTLLTFIYNLLGSMSPAVAAVLGVATTVVALTGYVNALWAELFQRVDQMAQTSTGGALDFSPVGFINAVFPLDALLTFMLAYGSLRLVCVGVRIIKSFIPTIS